MEAFQNDVNDRSIKVSGETQCITTPDSHTFPLNIKSGLPYINICPYTDDEWKKISCVILTLDSEWDPIIPAYSINDDDADNDECYATVSDTSTDDMIARIMKKASAIVMTEILR